jgi:hypothetical protein
MKRRLVHSCEGKVAFASRRVAKQVYDRMRKSRDGKFSLYRCKCCRSWHIGTKHIRMPSGHPLNQV